MAERILVIDDEERIQETLSEFFTDCGYEVSTAADGRLGLDTLRRFEPALVLLDLRLPDMNISPVLTNRSPQNRSNFLFRPGQRIEFESLILNFHTPSMKGRRKCSLAVRPGP